MTNIEYADVLEKLAARYRENETLKQGPILLSADTKVEMIAILKGIGGKWVKTMPRENDEYGSIYMDSVDIPPLRAYISRNLVCRKIVRFECEPLLSPEDEAELEAVI